MSTVTIDADFAESLAVSERRTERCRQRASEIEERQRELSVEASAANVELRNAWMDEIFARHPELDRFTWTVVDPRSWDRYQHILVNDRRVVDLEESDPLNRALEDIGALVAAYPVRDIRYAQATRGQGISYPTWVVGL